MREPREDSTIARAPVRRRHGRSAVLLIASLIVALIGPTARVRAKDSEKDSVATLKWGHENPQNIAKFRLFSTTDLGDHTAESWVDVGLPGADGVYRWNFDVPHDGEIWVSISAFDRYGLQSERTQWRHFVWEAGQGRLRPPDRAQLVE